MKYRGIASPDTVKLLLWEPLIFVLFPGVLILFSKDFTWGEKLLYGLCIYLTLFMISAFLTRNAFVIFKMDESGIGNKHIFLKWENIETIKLVAVDFTSYHVGPAWRTPLSSLICLGNPVSGGIFKQKKKKAVFLTLSQRNLLRMKSCNNGKSARVDEFIELYLKK